MSFTVICDKCGHSIKVTNENVGDFNQQYAWGSSDFKIDSSTTEIAVFSTYDMCNRTMLCKCGNKVTE